MSDRIAQLVALQVKKASAAPAPDPRSPLAASRAARAVPCIKHVLDAPAPKGTRHYAFLNLIVTSKHLGVPKTGAKAILDRAVRFANLGPGDPIYQTLDEVYAGAYGADRLACPSPHVEAWCKPNECPVNAGAFKFTRN